MRSILRCWYWFRSRASLSLFFCARPQYNTRPGTGVPSPTAVSHATPCTALTAAAASVADSKFTNPNPLDLPASSRMMTTLVMVPYSSNLVLRASSVTSSGKFFTNTFVNLGSLSSEGRSPFFMKGPTYTFLPFTRTPFMVSTALTAASSVSKCTKPYPLLLPNSVATLQERIVPKAVKVSCSALLSIVSSKFLMKMLPTPLFRAEGSRWLHMMRMGLPLICV
mmetsp:Transcript_8037/g.10856  ORF Transcript_8037/g.10856 Transcript_8037/m.10856 type:complete len:223 (-) Transcript_8037:673-1341(-)